jgi:hypothetical protein
MCLFCAAAMTPVGGGHRRVRTREAICTYKTHIWAVHSRALVPLIPQAPAPTRGEGGVWASSSPKRDRERRRLPRTCPCKARTSRPRGASRARCPRPWHADETPAIPGGAGCPRSQAGRMPALPGGAGCPRPWHAGETPALPGGAGCPRSQACGRDARAPRRGKMLAFPACGRDARAPRWGRMPASLACGRDARAPRRCRDTNGSSASGTRSLSHYSALARAGGLRPTPPARGGSGVEPGAYGL